MSPPSLFIILQHYIHQVVAKNSKDKAKATGEAAAKKVEAAADQKAKLKKVLQEGAIKLWRCVLLCHTIYVIRYTCGHQQPSRYSPGPAITESR